MGTGEELSGQKPRAEQSLEAGVPLACSRRGPGLRGGHRAVGPRQVRKHPKGHSFVLGGMASHLQSCEQRSDMI